MLKPRSSVIALSVSLFFVVGMLGNLVLLQKNLTLTEQNTIEYTATVEEIKTWGASDDTYINIVTEEYDSALMISLTISNQMGSSFLADLSNGDTIFFRIQDRMKESLEAKHMGDIVALRTAEREYFTLATYNEWIHEEAVSAKITAITISLIAFTVAIICVFRLINVWPCGTKRHKQG